MMDVDADILVIGHGMAGAVCASALAAHKKKVVVVGRGITTTALSTGCLAAPRDALKRKADYEEALSFFRSEVSRFLRYEGGSGAGTLLTSEGAKYVSPLAPRFTMAARRRKSYALLGIHGYGDFDPDRACRFSGERSHPYWTVLPGTPQEVELSSTDVSIRMEGEGEHHLAEALKDLAEDWVGMPPLFPYPDFDGRMERLERESGRNLFEVVTPLSLPGQRLQRALEEMVVFRGCRLMKGREVTRLRTVGREAVSATIRSGMREQTAHFSALILAGGDCIAGGLLVQGRKVADSFSTFLVENASGSNALEGALGSGLKVDRRLRPCSQNSLHFKNVWAAGSIVPHVSYASGGGLTSSLYTGWKAAHHAMEVL
jgi:anaerobic glycerol-3-phosphate dehydrogenase